MGLIDRIRKKFSKGKDGGITHSLVFLRRRAFPMTEAFLHEAVERAFNVTLPRGDPEATSFVVVERPSSMVKVESWVFVVHNFPTPYMEEYQRAAEEIPELRLRRAVEAHRAWLSVDLLHKPEGAQDQQVYQMIGRLLAEFDDGDCLALYWPSRGNLRPYDQSMLDHLRGQHPLKATARPPDPPVTEVAGEDPRLVAAVNEARMRFPEFVRAFKTGEGSYHSVKAPITAGQRTEFIWILVTGFEGSTIRGTLGNEPVDLPGLHEGDSVETTLDDLNDWVYMCNDELVGGFTTKVLEEIAKEH
ncbi:MAG: DUF2314 domain-containing protein [Planctomycetota bacterium]|nr:DUF2314 domain-containing protein [Planctomycetota bacterium]